MRFAHAALHSAAFAAWIGLAALCSCQPEEDHYTGPENFLGVVNTDPVTNTQNAYLDQSILLQFNQDVDPNTVYEGTIQVTGPSGTVNGTYTVVHHEVTFTPLQNFLPNTTYSVAVPGWASNPFCVLSVRGDALRQAYVLSFQTGTQYVPDTDPPSVAGIWVSNGSVTPVPLPTDNSTTVILDISPATAVVVEFDEGMNPSSFSPANFSLIDQNNPTTPLNGTFRFFNKNTRVVFYPVTTNPGGGFLSTASNYTLLLTSGLTDNSLNPSNNALAPAPIQAAFRTRAAWNEPSSTSPYAEDFSASNMLDPTNSNAIWNTAPTAQRLEGGYGAAALAGSGLDGDFTPTQSGVLNTSTRPFGYQYNTVNIPGGVTISVVGSRPGIIRARGEMTIRGVITADGNPGVAVTGFSLPGSPGGTGGPGGANGGSGNPANVNNYPWRSDTGGGSSGGTGGLWSTQTWNSGAWPWAGWTATGSDIPGSGGGGSNSTQGGDGTGTNLGAAAEGARGPLNNAGNPAVSGYLVANGAGSGGGGGGGGDDGGTPNAATDGDQILAYPPDDGGAGGGGGGGALNLTSGGQIVISGSITARGGAGGTNLGSGWGHTSGGVGGGGGSGGLILIQGLTVNVSGATFDARGGTGGTGGYTGGLGSNQYISRGGAGGSGWIRFESVSGTIIGEAGATINPTTAPSYSKGTLNLSTTQGQSLFFDTRVEDPDYLDHDPVQGNFTVNLILNSGSIQIFAQGADADSRGEPDPQTYWPNSPDNLSPSWTMVYDSTVGVGISPYTGNLNVIDRYRFFRFRAVFGNLLNVYPPGPYISDMTYPFRD